MMNDMLTVAVIASIPPTIAASAALIVALRNHSAVREVHLSVNSRLDELLKTSKAASFAEGVKAEGDMRDKEERESS